MKIYDISMEIKNDMMVYKNQAHRRPALEQTRYIGKDGVNESVLHINLHTGTHMDAQWHALENGKTIEEIDLFKCITPCRVLDFTHVEGSVTKDELMMKNIKKDDFILLKTKNSFTDDFDFGFVYLDSEAAEYLQSLGIKGVGIDSLGIERGQAGHPTHKALLSKGIVILEGLRLKDIEEGEYLLCALPLKIKGGDGSPVRACLIEM
ncbi:cyclase [Thermoclostridium stercorarium subsp. thermolacticum DSM 2910]|uniref:Kynurenine formamidase n=2 Tax=Thermoclostridium stercorarium TaxID=1510 RepID=A0A1B1YK85_THEST|nr:cyclase family protein [Thermoclostridium stercorarium]ANW98590.1 cyclase [Thermoclostridium stercorarium subsp. thermolacticum DSM 2910]ANX01132.1 cyclase [Thermoclostridium stercorarium subsp. leptospartum DSM 9219]